MADFFSQFQVHPPGPNMGNEGQYAGVPTGAQPTAANGYQSPFQDFNLGGFQPAPPGAPFTSVGFGSQPLDPNQPMQPPDWKQNYNLPDPRVTTQPQPYQQGPGGIPQGNDMPYQLPDGSWTGGFGGGTWNPKDGSPFQVDPNYKPFIPPAIAKDPNKPGAFIDPGTGQPYQGGPPMDMQHIMGTIGAGAGGIGNMMRGHGMTPPQQAMLGSAISRPMNPSQQSGALGSPMVQMMGPDGSQQYVDPAHVPHYTSLGATLMNPQAMQQIGLGAQVTGQQLAGMSGSSYGGG